jgi:predicted MFS family arabinose efflux permease
MLVVGGMFSMFFFLSQYLQGARGYTPLETGIAFLPMTLVMFSMVQVVPRLVQRYGNTQLLMAGVSLAAIGMTWLSRIDADTPFLPGIAVPLAMLGLGIGAALAPLTAAGIAGVEASDAGAASGVVNASQQLGLSLGLSVLVTVFAGAGGDTANGAGELAHAVSVALTGSATLLTLALAVIVFVVARPAREPAPLSMAERAESEVAAVLD